jgi:dihydroxyacid dehydratase/phosphogluconate dehydratase
VTREQLDAIRGRVDELNATNGHEPAAWEENRLSMANTNALLAEVEGMRESCTGLVKQNERQYDEVLRLTAERDTAMDRMQQAIIDLLNEHNAPLHLIARVVEMEYP